MESNPVEMRYTQALAHYNYKHRVGHKSASRWETKLGCELFSLNSPVGCPGDHITLQPKQALSLFATVINASLGWSPKCILIKNC